MTYRHLSHLRLISGAMMIAMMAAPAFAEGEADAGDGGLTEITVTAQKHESNLQKTPIAISVLGGDDLASRNIQSLENLMDGGVPSLRIAPFFSRSSALTVGIRGIVPFDANQPSRDAGVGVYIDGVYLGRSQGLGTALFDIERIEVLKGPQGTLFGRNSTGGAVSIVSRKPTGEFHLRQTAGISNFGGYKVESHLDLPRFANISVKLDGIVTKRNGTVDNPLAGEEDFNQYDRRGLHAEALWEPSDTFSADYAFDISYDATTPYYVQLLEKNPAATLAQAVQVQANRASVADIGVPEQESIGKTHGHMLHLNWQPADAIEVRSISSYRKLSQSQFDNGGAHTSRFVPNGKFARYSLADLHQKQYSQEVQLLGKLSRLDFVTGVYYYHEKGDDNAWTPNTLQWDATTGATYTRLPSLVAGQQTPFPDRASTAVANSFAVFGQATWTPAVLDDALHVTGGARYTRDKKHGVLFKVNGADTSFAFRNSSNRIDPTITLAIDAADGIHIYGKWGTAYRAGGANSRSVNYRAFDPETVSTYEAGLKTEFWDRHARLNVAAYSTRYKNIQIDFSASNLNGSNRGTLETVNAPGHGTIKGIEADATIVPFDGLTLTASYAYTDSHLPQAANPFNNNTLQNVFIVYTPKNAVTGAIDYQLPLRGATVRAHLDANAADGYHSSSSETTMTDSSFIVNGRLSVGDIDLRGAAKLEVSIWSRNLFNEDHSFYEARAAYSVIGTYGMFNEPRTYGVDATIRF